MVEMEFSWGECEIFAIKTSRGGGVVRGKCAKKRKNERERRNDRFVQWKTAILKEREKRNSKKIFRETNGSCLFVFLYLINLIYIIF